MCKLPDDATAVCTDGDAGQVTDVFVDPDPRRITRIVVRGKDAGGHGSVATWEPAEWMKTQGNGVLYLPRLAARHAPVPLRRSQVEWLLRVLAGGSDRPVDGQPGSCRLVSIIFEALDRADAALRLTRAEASLGTIGRIEAAVVRKAADGSLCLHVDRDLSTGRGAVADAVAGNLLGFLVGPIGVIDGSAVGAATGGHTAGVAERGVPDRYVRELGRALWAKSSAIVFLVDRHFERALLKPLAVLGGEVLPLALSDDMLERLICP